MIFRNSKLELILSLVTALFNAGLSLLLLSLLTDWSLAPFALILAVLFVIYACFTFITWQAEQIEVTPQAVNLTFGIKTKQKLSLAKSEVTFLRLHTKRFHQLVGLARCQLQLSPEQTITLTLRQHVASLLEHQFQKQPSAQLEATANRLDWRQLPRFIINETQWLSRGTNLFCLLLIAGILLTPDILLQLPLWLYIVIFSSITLLVWFVNGITSWLTSRYFALKHNHDQLIVQTGFLQPQTFVFEKADLLMLEEKQAFGYRFHKQAAIFATIDETKKLSKKPLRLAPLLAASDIPAWFATYFPEIDRNSRQYRPKKSAWLSYAASAPIFLTLLIGFILLFFTRSSDQWLLLICVSVAFGFAAIHQYQRWRYSFLCQLTDFFILDFHGLTHRVSYFAKQRAVAKITQSRYQSQRGLGTFRISFPNHSLQSVSFAGIAQKKQ